MPFRSRQRWFFLSLILILTAILVGKFVLPMQLRAQQTPLGGLNGGNPPTAASVGTSDSQPVNGNRIGPEFAFFDKGGETTVFHNVIQKNNFHGTMQVINSIHGAPYNPVDLSWTIVPEAHFVLRIVEIHNQGSANLTPDQRKLCGDSNARPTTDAEIKNFAQQLNSSSAFPDGTIVMFGNELNNLQKENCSNPIKNSPSTVQKEGAEYGEKFKLFASVLNHGSGKKYLLVPNSVDLNNPEFLGTAWITGVKSTGAYNQADGLAASVFDVTPAPGVGHTNLTTYQYYEEQTGKTVIHFAGWGSDPSLSVADQVKFLNTKPLPATKDGKQMTAATLIANTCPGHHGNQTDDWLFYTNGIVTDKDGHKIDPATCGIEPDAPLFVYPGIDDQKTTQDKLKMASTYIMTCASPLNYTGSISSEKKWSDPSSGDYQSFGLNCPGDTGCLIPNVVGTASLNDEKTSVPLFRFETATVPNNDSPTRRMDDLQGFFSAKYAPLKPAGENILSAPLANGVNSKIAPLTLQCQNTIDFLKSIQKSCDLDQNLPNPTPINYAAGDPQPAVVKKIKAHCALDIPIGDGTETYLSVLSKMPASFSCDNYGQILSQTTQVDFNSFASLLSRVEITTPKAFKPAYLVEYTNYPETAPANENLTKSRNWLPVDGSIDDKRRKRITVTKVYVPAGFATTPTDRSVSLAANNSQPATNYVSDFINTMMALMPFQDQQKIVDNKNQQMDTILKSSTQGSLIPSPGDPTLPNKSKFLNCPECKDDANGKPADLESIFVRRINAEIANPSQDNKNNTDCSVPDLAGEQATSQKASVNPQITTDPVKQVNIQAKAALREEGKAPDPNSDLKTRRFLLLPEEYQNVTDYQDVLVNSFLPYVDSTKLTFSDVKLPDSATDKSYKYLQMGDSTMQINSPETKGAAVGQFITAVQAPTAADIPQTTQTTTTGTPPDNSASSANGIDGTTPAKPAQIPPRTRQVNLTGTVITQPQNYDANPQIPGGKLARGLWEIMCHVTLPFNPNKTLAPYQGFENFLKQGTDACYTGTPNAQLVAPVVPPVSTTTLSEYFKSLFNISVRYSSMRVPPKTCSFVYVTKEQAQQYAAELPQFAAALLKGLQAKGIHSMDNAPMFNNCGGEGCTKFFGDISQQVPVCDGSVYVNPYYMFLISMNEWSPTTIKPDGTGYYFGCQPYAFSKFIPNATYEGIACETKMDPKTNMSAVSPIIPSEPLVTNGNGLSDTVLNACVDVNGGAVQLGQARQDTLTFEDGLACFMGRMQNSCELSLAAGKTADPYAMSKYSYNGTNGGDNIAPGILKNLQDYTVLAQKYGGFTPSFTGGNCQ